MKTITISIWAVAAKYATDGFDYVLVPHDGHNEWRNAHYESEGKATRLAELDIPSITADQLGQIGTAYIENLEQDRYEAIKVMDTEIKEYEAKILSLSAPTEEA